MADLGTLVPVSPLNISNNTKHSFTLDITESVTFVLGDTPADLVNMDTLSWQVEYALANTFGDDTYDLAIRIINGGTILAALNIGGTVENVATNIQNTTDVTSSVTSFTYVNTSASKTDWDGATVELTQTYSKSKGSDANGLTVDYVAITGTYTAGAVPTTFYHTVLSTRTRSNSINPISTLSQLITSTRIRSTNLIKKISVFFQQTRTRSSNLIKKTSLKFLQTRTHSISINYASLISKTISIIRTRSTSLINASTFFTSINVVRTRSIILLKKISVIFTQIRTRTESILKKTSKSFLETRIRSTTYTYSSVIQKLLTLIRTRSTNLSISSVIGKTISLIRTRTSSSIQTTLYGVLSSNIRTRTSNIAKRIMKTFSNTRIFTTNIPRKISKNLINTRTRNTTTQGSSLVNQLIVSTRTRLVSSIQVFQIVGETIKKVYRKIALSLGLGL